MPKIMKKWLNLALSAGLLLTNTCGSTSAVLAVEEPLVVEQETSNPENMDNTDVVETTDEEKVKAALEYAEIQEKENPGFQFEYSKKVDENDASYVDISLSIAIENEEINNMNVLLPDANISDKMDVEYIAPCNGIYRFRIYYEIDGVEHYYDYYINVEESNRMLEPNSLPDYSNGFVSNEELYFNSAKLNMMSSDDGYREQPSGNMWVKLFVGPNGQATVDGERFGTGGSGKFIAYMSDAAGNAMLCIEPGQAASVNLEDYAKTSYGINNNWPGKSEEETVEMALIWYYGTMWLPNNEPNGHSSDEWYLTTQLMLWEILGSSIDAAPSYVSTLESKIMEKVRAYQALLKQSYEEDKVYIKKRLPWDGTNSVINSKGELNPAFEYKLINVNAKGGTVINMGDPTYAWPISGKSDKDLIKEKVETHSTAKTEDDCKAAADGYAWNKDTKVCEKKTYLVETSNVQVVIQDSSPNRNDYATSWVNQTKSVQATYSYDGSSTFYNFRMVGELSDGSTAEMYDNDILSYSFGVADSAAGEIWMLTNPDIQDLVSFAVPPLARKMRTFRFAYNPEGTPVTPDIPEKEPVQPPVIVIPDFNKYDNEGNDLTHDYSDMPVQGAEFEFYSGGYFKMDWVMEKKVLTESVYTPPVPCTPQEGGGCTGGAPGYTTYYYEIQDPVPSSAGGKYKPANVFTERNHKFEGVDGVTDSDGFIDLTPIADEIADTVEEHKQRSKDENLLDDFYTLVSVDERLPTGNYYYVDPDYYWKGGNFYFQEPTTSSNQFRDDAVKKGNTDFVGYQNLYPGQKYAFRMGEEGAGDTIIEHKNDRQHGRFTIHKIDNESSYLNHNNVHEAQGDGYFQGAVYVITAKEDIILHDGTTVNSDFNGKPLVAGEIADIIVLDETGTGVSLPDMELGRYAYQEVRLPGIYVYDIETKEGTDGLQHVVYSEKLINDILNKDSDFYQFDYAAAHQMYLDGKISIDSPDGGYWYKDYKNGLANTSTNLYAFVGGQTQTIDLKYVGEEYEYNEAAPSCTTNTSDSNHKKTEISAPEAGVHWIPDDYGDEQSRHITTQSSLDYANSISKGHLQLLKRISQGVDVNKKGDGTGVDDSLNIAAPDIYFAITLLSKDETIADGGPNAPALPDKYFAQKRADGLEYIYDANENFKLFVETGNLGDDSQIREATADEIAAGKGLIAVQNQDGSYRRLADNYYESIKVEVTQNTTSTIYPSHSYQGAVDSYHFEKRNTFVNPSAKRGTTALTTSNLSDKNLYMVLKTDNEGKAGTNMPNTIVWATKGNLNNTTIAGSYGKYLHEKGILYDPSATEKLDYLQESGLPLPYGVYKVTELNPYEGYEAVTYTVTISKNLTTVDINDEETVWELGIEEDSGDAVYIKGNKNPSPKTPTWTVAGDGTAKDTTWLNKQFHVFSNYMMTSRYNGEQIEDKLNRQILEIKKVDAETKEIIEAANVGFKLWQWNPNLVLEDSYKHAEYVCTAYEDHDRLQTDGSVITEKVCSEGDWKITYEVPTGDANNEITDVKIYNARDDWYTDEKGLTQKLGQFVKTTVDLTADNGTYSDDAKNERIYWTNSKGLITLHDPLPAANYMLIEMAAPDGYTLPKKPLSFDVIAINEPTDVNENDVVLAPIRDEDGNFVCKAGYPNCNDKESVDSAYARNEYNELTGEILMDRIETEKVRNFITLTITAEDMPQKAYISIEKRGSVFDRFILYRTDELDLPAYKPTWTEDSLIKLETGFCIYASEDIIINGDVKAKEGECVEKLTTTREGIAVSQELYLGEYDIKECDPPHGYITNEAAIHVSLDYEGQHVRVYPVFTGLNNERQTVQFEINKKLEGGAPANDIYFGLYSAEDLPLMHEAAPDPNEDAEWNEDTKFNDRTFTEDGFANLGKVTDYTYEGLEASIMTKTRSFEGEDFDIKGFYVTGYTGSESEITVPERIFDDASGQFVPVVGIDDQALMDKGLVKVYLPDTISYIGKQALADNQDLKMIRFYETGQKNIVDDLPDVDMGGTLSPEEETCGMANGYWDGSVCTIPTPLPEEGSDAENELPNENEGINDPINQNAENKENVENKEMVLEPVPTPVSFVLGVRMLDFDSMITDLSENNDGTDETNLDPVVDPDEDQDGSDQPETKNNTQIACEANNGTYDPTTGTCSGAGPVDEGVDEDMNTSGISPSQQACEALGYEWDLETGTCSSEQNDYQGGGIDPVDPDFGIIGSRESLFIDQSALDWTPSLVWIIAPAANYARFDEALIVSGNDVIRDGHLDGTLRWNPELLNPYTNAVGYWELSENQPAVMGHPITLNTLNVEDPLDADMNVDPEKELPVETVTIPADTLLEVIRIVNGKGTSSLDYPEGKYYVKEIQTVKGYDLDRTLYPIEFKADETGTKNHIIKVNDGEAIINKKSKVTAYRVKVLKKDGNTLTALSGAEFELWDYSKKYVLETGIVTNSKGEAVTKGLYSSNASDSEGNSVGYWLKEVKAPEGYDLPKNVWTYFEIDDDKEVGEGYWIVNVKNYKEPDEPSVTPGGDKDHSIVIETNKAFEKNPYYENDEAYLDVVFGLYAEKDILDRKDKVLYAKDELILKTDINKEGKTTAEIKLPKGTYYLKELSTEAHYLVNDKKLIFEVTSKDKHIILNNGKTFINKLKKTDLMIFKQDAETRQALADAEFILYNEDMKELETVVTDAEGMATFKGLPNGLYYLKESKAPAGYQLNEELQKIMLESDKENTLRIYDVLNVAEPLIVPEIPKEPEFEIPDSGVIGTLPQSIVIILIGLLSVLLICLIKPYFKKKETK